jgi:TolB protein
MGDDDVYVVNLDGSGLVRMTGDDAPNYFPRWSPDGTAIAFQSGREVTNISTISADGSGPTNLSSDLLGAYDAVWSPITDR